MVELTGNAGMSGTFGYEATAENNQNSALCKTVQGGLRILNMNGLGLAGLALPDCLMGKTSTLEEIRLGRAPALSARAAVKPLEPITSASSLLHPSLQQIVMLCIVTLRSRT